MRFSYLLHVKCNRFIITTFLWDSIQTLNVALFGIGTYYIFS